MTERVFHLIFLLTRDKRMMDTFHSNNLNSPAWFRTSPLVPTEPPQAEPPATTGAEEKGLVTLGNCSVSVAVETG